MKPNRQDSGTRQARAEEALFRAIVSLKNTGNKPVITD